MKNGRKEFLLTLTELAEKDSTIILIIGDVGFSFLDDFKSMFPKQLLNVGIMEQCMMGFAAGLAQAGMKPYVYTMRNFIAFRPYEQVRLDIAFSNNNVKLIGVSGSEAYKFLGASHNVFTNKDGTEEDVAMLQELPNMVVHYPSDEKNVSRVILDEYERLGPAYIII